MMQLSGHIVQYAQSVIAVSSALGVIFGSAYGITRYTMNREVIPALRRNKDEFKAWSTELYQEEYDRNENSARSIESIEKTLSDITIEMQKLRISMTKHDETLIALPGILTSLNDTLSRHARTDDRLGDVLTQLSKDVNDTKIHVAHIMGKLSMEPRRTMADVPTIPAR